MKKSKSIEINDLEEAKIIESIIKFKKMTKINWSGRAHYYSQEDINYLVKVIKNADPLTQGKYLNKFELIYQDILKQIIYLQ